MSKSGVSTSIGGKGLTLNIKDGKTTTTASLPGTFLPVDEDDLTAISNLGMRYEN